jgi:hypothetical protein
MREEIPGQIDPVSEHQSPDLFHTRTQIGQVTTVKEADGIVSIRVEPNADESQAVIPLLGLSVNGVKSSWGRYMPDRGALIKCAYGPDDSLQPLSYGTWGSHIKTGESEDGDGVFLPEIGGYSQLKDLQEKNVPGINTFRQLRCGEWDFRSSGNAYFHLSNQGHVLLTGGLASINLDKNRFEANHESGLITHGAEGTISKLGDVKRLLNPLTDVNETVIDTATKEYLLKVSIPNPIVETKMVDVRAGDVRGDSIAAFSPSLGPLVTDPVLNTPSVPAPLRYRAITYDITGQLEQFKAEIDLEGHLEINHNLTPSPKGMRLSGLLGNLQTEYLKTNIASLTTTNIDATAAVLLGDELIAPTNPVVKGSVWTVARQLKNSFILGAHTANAALFPSQTAAFAAISAFMLAYAAENPSVNPLESGPLATLASGASLAVAGFSVPAATAATSAASAVATFEANAITYLSLKVFTE